MTIQCQGLRAVFRSCPVVPLSIVFMKPYNTPSSAWRQTLFEAHACWACAVTAVLSPVPWNVFLFSRLGCIVYSCFGSAQTPPPLRVFLSLDRSYFFLICYKTHYLYHTLAHYKCLALIPSLFNCVCFCLPSSNLSFL